MIKPIKDLAKRHWPALHLRTVLLGTLLFTAALPGFGALFLRVYENTLMRQTEAELVAQGAALVAVASTARVPAGDYRAEASTIDLGTTPILGERPAATHAPVPTEEAVAIGARLEAVADATARTTLAAIQFLDANGTIVFGHETGGSYTALPEVRAALAGRSATVLRRNGSYAPRYDFEWLSRASALRIHHARPVIADGKVVGVILLSRSSRALFRGLYEDRGKILLGMALIFGTLVVLTGLLSRGIVRPIETLTTATRTLAGGRVTVPDTPVTATIEIRALFDNFRTMADAIDARSRYLRDFAASMAHEFKTPLAGIRGGVELLGDHAETMTSADRARFLANIDADAARLSLLVSRLLDLARADMATPGEGERCDVAAIARQLADALTIAGFAVSVTGAGSATASLKADALETVLSMLVENARQAGATTAEIAIAIGDDTSVTVRDDGPGVVEGDRARLFEPFFTTRRTSGGTGLGLPIARSLLAANGGTIDYVARESGAAFVVRLPV